MLNNGMARNVAKLSINIQEKRREIFAIHSAFSEELGGQMLLLLLLLCSYTAIFQVYAFGGVATASDATAIAVAVAVAVAVAATAVPFHTTNIAIFV